MKIDDYIYNIIEMLQKIQYISELNDIFPYAVHLIVILIVYIAYYVYFKGITFKIAGNYNTKSKNIGHTLPSFPNGWYVAVHSKYLQIGKSQAVDIAGQNIVVFRSQKGEPFALEAYCKHLGANLGIGGKVVNQKCIQCPFHGWLYDGQTGLCVDFDGKPAKGLNVEYNDDFCQKGKKLNWIRKNEENIKLRKYPVCEMNGYIYVWIHALEEHQSKPTYPMIDLCPITKDLEYRARTIHQVKCHIQDIPQNGADILHFKYVHSEIIPKINLISFLWKAKWKRGDDPDIKQMFQHPSKMAKDFKQKIYSHFIEKFPRKQFLSIGNLDNYVKLPIFGHIFAFNVTIIQLGCSTVFILLKSPIFTIVLFHFLQPKYRYEQIVYHEGYSSKWMPYWASAFAVKMQGNQVTNDMHLWDSKKFGRNIFLKKDQQADIFIKGWREWYSQHYQGCLDKQKQRNKLNW